MVRSCVRGTSAVPGACVGAIPIAIPVRVPRIVGPERPPTWTPRVRDIRVVTGLVITGAVVAAMAVPGMGPAAVRVVNGRIGSLHHAVVVIHVVSVPAAPVGVEASVHTVVGPVHFTIRGTEEDGGG